MPCYKCDKFSIVLFLKTFHPNLEWLSKYLELNKELASYQNNDYHSEIKNNIYYHCFWVQWLRGFLLLPPIKNQYLKKTRKLVTGSIALRRDGVAVV